MISDNIKRLRENTGLSQAALARKLGVTRASVNAWEMELSAPTAQYLIALAQLFHTTTDDILGLESQEQIVLRGMNEQEKRLCMTLWRILLKGKRRALNHKNETSNNIRIFKRPQPGRKSPTAALLLI